MNPNELFVEGNPLLQNPMQTTGQPQSSTPPPIAQPATLPTDPVQATTREVKPLETVQGQLNDLFQQGNPLMVQAREGAQRMAAGRGLQNSTMAAQSGEQALFSSALPIAAQDANTHAATAGQNQQAQNTFGLTERQGQIQAGLNQQGFEQQMAAAKQQFGFDASLSAQDAHQRLSELAAQGDQQARLALLGFEFETSLTNLRGQIALNQSNADFANDLIKLATQGDIQSRLQMEQFGFNSELSAQENIHRLEQLAAQGDINAQLQLQQFQFQSLLNDQQNGFQLTLEDKRFQQNQNLLVMEYAQRAGLTNLEARNAMTQMNQQHANTLVEIQARAAAGNTQAAQDAGRALQNNYLLTVADRQRSTSAEIAAIYQTEGLSAAQQNTAVTNAYNRMQQDLALLSAYYKSSPLWDPNFQLPGATPTAAPSPNNPGSQTPGSQVPGIMPNPNPTGNPTPLSPNYWTSSPASPNNPGSQAAYQPNPGPGQTAQGNQFSSYTDAQGVQWAPDGYGGHTRVGDAYIGPGRGELY